MYQYSLEWFIGIFLNSIANADASGTWLTRFFLRCSLQKEKVIKILVFILNDIFITNNQSIGSSAGLLTEGMKFSGHFPKGIKHMLVEVYEILRSLPKITDVVTNPAFWYCPLVVTFLYTFKIYCQLYRRFFVAAFVGLIRRKAFY